MTATKSALRRLRPVALALIVFACAAEAAPVELKAPPVLDRAVDTSFDLRGHVRDSIDAVTEHWLLRASIDNPAMLDMFRDRDRQPYRDLLPWSGEFVGKHLTAGTQVLRLTGDAKLRAHLRKLVDELVTLQDSDGYLGPFPKDSHLTGKAPNCPGTWDAWGHYHIMLGLLLWNELTDDEKAFRCATRIGDLMCDTFLKSGKRVLDMGSPEMNQAIAHGMSLLYRRSGDKRHLELAQKIVEEFALPGAGDYLRTALAGKAFYQTAKPRWESLHPILSLVELHRLTGNEDDRKAFERLWWSIVEFDRHDNGGFSSGEQATGNPYDQGAIETCCTIAWLAMGVEMLKTTGDSVVADELELSTLNQVMGLHSADGSWCTYNTPMDGVRKPSTIDISFQKRPGSEQLNCCSVNAARGFGLISEWALLTERDGGGLALNWYGPSTMTATIAANRVTLEQTTDYPRAGHVALTVTPVRPATFTLKLRMPHWSAHTVVAVNGQALAADETKPARYCAIRREWKAGDEVTLDFDFSPNVWAGEKQCGGKAAIYRGPLLMAYDFSAEADALPKLSMAKIDAATLEDRRPDANRPWVAMRVQSEDGRQVRLIDYASAGENGLRYASWLPVPDAPATPFSHEKPLRGGRR